MSDSLDPRWQALAVECYKLMQGLIERWGDSLPTSYGQITREESSLFLDLWGVGQDMYGLSYRDGVIQAWRRGPRIANIQELLGLSEKLRKTAEYYASQDMQKAIDGSIERLQKIREALK